MLDKIRDRVEADAELGKTMADAHLEEEGGTMDSFGMDDRAQNNAMRVVSLVVALTVGAIVAAFLLPIGLQELTAADLGANASDGATALWGILDVIIVLAVFLFFIGIALAGANRV